MRHQRHDLGPGLREGPGQPGPSLPLQSMTTSPAATQRRRADRPACRVRSGRRPRMSARIRLVAGDREDADGLSIDVELAEAITTHVPALLASALPRVRIPPPPL